MHFINALAFVALSNIYSATASCVHNTNLYPRSVGADGELLELPSFSYDGNSGPTNWEAIDANNTECATGQNQSPINIKSAEISKIEAGEVQMEIPAGQNITFENLGTNVQVVMEGTTTISGRKFDLKQFHYHTPSEHKIDAEYYPVEVHMVHTAEDDPNEIVVIGMLFQLGSEASTTGPSAIFSNVLSSISSIPEPGNFTELSPSSDPSLDFTALTSALPTMSFYTYTGSLTTPPCSEGITFYFVTEPLSMGVDTYNAMKKVVKFNSRFVQNELGEQNLLEISKLALERIEAGLDIVPMPKGEEMVDHAKKTAVMVHGSPRFRP